MTQISTITAIDIGTATVKALVVKKSPDGAGFDVLAKAEGISAGMRSGGVVDPNKLSKVIRRVVAEVEKEAGIKIEDVYANINGAHIFSIPSKGTITISRVDQEITEEDVSRAINEAKTFSIPPNKEIVETVPRSYTIDKESGIKNPVGLNGVRLTADIIVVGVFTPFLKGVTEAVLGADLHINDLIIDPVAAAKAVLTTEEKELGVVLVNFGASTTSIAVYKDENLLLTKVIPAGVHHVRNDIATGLQVDIETAEFIKSKLAGGIFGDRSTRKETVKFTNKDEVTFPRNQLRKIMEERITQIFSAVKDEVEAVCPRNELPGGVVLTGGGAKIPHIKDFARKTIGLSCRIGRPRRFFNLDDDPSYSTLCGLVLCGEEFEEEGEPRINLRNISSKIKKVLRSFLP